MNDEIDPFSHLLSFSLTPPHPLPSPMQSINQSILTEIRTHLLHILANAAAQHTATRHLYATWQPSTSTPPRKIIVEISSHTPSSFLRQVPHDTTVSLPRAPPSRTVRSVNIETFFLPVLFRSVFLGWLLERALDRVRSDSPWLSDIHQDLGACARLDKRHGECKRIVRLQPWEKWKYQYKTCFNSV